MEVVCDAVVDPLMPGELAMARRVMKLSAATAMPTPSSRIRLVYIIGFPSHEDVLI